MHASTGVTDKYFVQKIKVPSNGCTHRFPETESDIVNYTSISHNDFFFSGRVVEGQ